VITEKDLQEAIAECEGIRNPNATTCIKLAAFYTIKRELFGGGEPAPMSTYSFALPRQDSIDDFESDTEFGRLIAGKNKADVWMVIDDLMTTLSIVNPRLYDSVIRKVNQI
jgi:hypothetical protein